jgi:hypothetical protein
MSEGWDDLATRAGAGNGVKTYDPAIIDRSVVDVPETVDIAPSDHSLITLVASTADGILPWGRAPKVRDRQLRDFIPQESWFASALASVCARNSAFSWRLEGPDRLVEAAHEMLVNANRGKGWQSLMVQITMDLHTQDLGAFVELIRAGDAPTSPVINVAHLDSARCYPTGNPEVPVIYIDRFGRMHRMKWYQVINIQEMPSGYEVPHAGVFYSLQYSTLSRLLRYAQILRNIGVLRDEKTAGRFTRQIVLVSGTNPKKIEDAITQGQFNADALGLQRFMHAIFMGGATPDAEVKAQLIDLATTGDGYDEDKTIKWYVAAMALAFLVDYQEFAPLPGGNLGTSTQSETLHMKTRGKGPALFQKTLSHAINFFGILPRPVTFAWDEQDIDADRQVADVLRTRAEARAKMVDSGEIDDVAAGEMAVVAGDLTEEQYDGVQQRRAERRQEAERIAQQRAQAPSPDERRPNAPVESGPSDMDSIQQDDSRGKAMAPGRRDAEEAFEDEVADEFDDIFAELARETRRRRRGDLDGTAAAFHDELKRDLGQKGVRRVLTRFRRDPRTREILSAEQEERWGR